MNELDSDPWVFAATVLAGFILLVVIYWMWKEYK